MKPFFKHVSVPTKILRDDFVFPDPGKPSPLFFRTRIHKEDFHVDFINWLAGKKLRPDLFFAALIFHAFENSTTMVHTDFGGKNIWALNCQITPNTDIKITWHDTEDILHSIRGDLNLDVHPSDSPVITSTSLSNTLTSISTPHCASSINSTGWFVSVRVFPYYASWDLLEKLFN